MAATTTELLGRIADINNTTVMFLWHATASCSTDRHAAQTRLVEGLRLLTSLCNETGLYADLGEVGSSDFDSFTVTILPLALDEQQSESSQEIFQALFLISRPESLSQANAVAAVLLYNLALLHHSSGEQSGTSRRVGVALKLYQQSRDVLQQIPASVPGSVFHKARNILVAAQLINLAFAHKYFFDRLNATNVFRELAQHVQTAFQSSDENIPREAVSYFEAALLFNLGNLGSGHQPSPAA